MKSLELQNLSASYKGVSVLKDINLDVGAGELVSLLGPSGCGKSTTLNLVAGFITPDTGTVMVNGKSVSATPPYKRDVAVVFQNYALFPHMTVAENIAYGLRAKKVNKEDTRVRVAEVSKLLDIEALLDRHPGELSGGQQQRVAVARGVAVRPGILLMDEPLSNLDVKLRQSIRIEFRKLQQDLNQAVLFVTHDQEEALSMSDRVAVMREGKIEQFSSPREIHDHPETVYVADFMGVENILSLDEAESSVFSTGLRLLEDVELHHTHVGIRPSSISLLREGETAASGSIPIFAGVVENIAYLGKSMRYEVRLTGEKHLIVEQPVIQGVAEPGSHVRGAIRPTDLLRLRDTPSQPLESILIPTR